MEFTSYTSPEPWCKWCGVYYGDKFPEKFIPALVDCMEYHLTEHPEHVTQEQINRLLKAIERLDTLQ